MKALTCWLWKAGLALLVFPALTLPVQGAGIGFKSEHSIPLIVQGASNINNIIRRGQPVLIQPGKVGWDLNLRPGTRFITIYDARQPSRILYQGSIPFQGRDVIFSIRPSPRNPTQLVVVPIMAP
jgi:hypothetical protein